MRVCKVHWPMRDCVKNRLTWSLDKWFLAQLACYIVLQTRSNCSAIVKSTIGLESRNTRACRQSNRLAPYNTIHSIRYLLWLNKLPFRNAVYKHVFSAAPTNRGPSKIWSARLPKCESDTIITPLVSCPVWIRTRLKAAGVTASCTQ